MYTYTFSVCILYVATPQTAGPDAPCGSGRQDLCHARTDSKDFPGSNLSCTVRDPIEMNGDASIAI